MNNDDINSLIDLSLILKDEKWFNELVELKKNNININNVDNFNQISIALQDLNWFYAINDKYGIRNILSDLDFKNGEIVRCKEMYKQDEEVKFKCLNNEELIFIYGFWLGFNQGLNNGYDKGYTDGLENGYKNSINTIKEWKNNKY